MKQVTGVVVAVLIISVEQTVKTSLFNSQDLEYELSRLDDVYNRLTIFVERLTEENRELGPLVQNATIHAERLQRQAELLER